MELSKFQETTSLRLKSFKNYLIFLVVDDERPTI